MGVLRLPARYDYWRQKKDVYATNFGKYMPRDRFNQIWRYLHLYNREAPPPETPDKLLKIRSFIDYLNQKFQTLYTPYGYCTIDESMIRFKGRLGFRQYMPAKPVKWGVKVWALAESKTGYLHRFQIYTGKDEREQNSKGLTHRVVTDLLGHIQHKNLRVFMDNFYSSVPLFRELRMRGVYACGTVRANRKELPVDLLPKNIRLKKHEYAVAQNDDLAFCVWMDTKAVCTLSNFHKPDITGTVNRRTGHARQQTVHVPEILSDYQQHMKGVDLMDQMVGYYMPNHRSRKWWRRIFHYLQTVSAFNAYVVARDSHPEVVRDQWPNFQDFFEDIGTGLIGDHRAKRHVPVAAPVVPLAAQDQNIVPRPVGQHTVENMYGAKRKSCQVCRLRVGKGGRVPATALGCRQCAIPVCQKCLTYHVAN